MSAQPSEARQPEESHLGAHAAEVLAVQQVVEAHAEGRLALTDNLVAAVRSLIEDFHQWYDDLAVRRLSKKIDGLVKPAQRAMASQEDAYLSRVASMLSGHTVRPVGQVAVDDLRKGVDPEQVYERLAVQYRYERSTDTPAEDATVHVLTRADVMNQTDVALAARQQDHKFVTQHAIDGYRRVIHPELSQGGACGLCIAASGRIYHVENLLPIHDRCKCGVVPIIGGVDPGGSLNNLDLKTLYSNAGSTSKKDLKRTRYRIDDHGELGAVLVPKRRAGGGSVTSGAKEVGGLAGMTDEQIAHQLNITKGLKDSPWRAAQLARLKAEQARRAH